MRILTFHAEAPLRRALIPSLLLLATALLGPAPQLAGQAAQSPYAEDVASLDAIVDALYDVISGPAGEARDWDRFRYLFHPEAGRLLGMGVNADGEIVHRAMTPDDYVELSGPSLEANGFFEQEIGREEHRFGNVAHRFSAYAGRRSADDAEPFVRGINSIQAMWDGERWWIVTVLWDPERPDNPIPERYLEG